MKNIAYYISDYGYGHASRSIAIIRKLLEKTDAKIIVCNSFALTFVKDSLNSNRIIYRNIKTDVGYFLEEGSIHPDKVRIKEKYSSFISDWERIIIKERDFLRINNINLVISDISPLPFEAAESLGIPTVGISNFTWYTAYHGLLDEFDLSIFKESYKKMTFFFALAGFNEKWNMSTCEYGFFSRDVNPKEVKNIRRIINPSQTKKIIFLGLGMKIDVGLLNELAIWDSPNCVFLVSSNVKINRPNVFMIPIGYLESQNFIAASNLIITKAGWGMVGEAVCANVPLLILNRPSLKEDQNTMYYLCKNNMCEIIDWEPFKTYKVDSLMIDKMNALKKANMVQSYYSNKIATNLKGILESL